MPSKGYQHLVDCSEKFLIVSQDTSFKQNY